MADRAANDVLAALRGVRNVRAFTPDPVPDDALDAILDVARLTGSAMNAQPWEFVVVRDRERIAALAATGPNLAWLAGAPLVICLVMAGEQPNLERYDEGRLAERIMVAANALGYGAGLGWFFGAAGQARGRSVLGVPESKDVRTLIAVGKAGGAQPKRPAEMPYGTPPKARKPLSGLVHHERYGQRTA